MTQHLSILEEAISDVGYWRWWAEALPEVFQVEFGGVQLHFPPASLGERPNSVVALRFFEPSVVAFFTQKNSASVDKDWRIALHEDRISPFNVEHDLFTLTSEEMISEIVANCSIEYFHGNDMGAASQDYPVLLAFSAHEVGFLIRAKRMAVVAQPGELEPEQIVQASAEWWKYWRRYWQHRGTALALPEDYACEVTIPIKE